MSAPLRILIAALGGEGGGVLMNWIVEAARNAGRKVQATSVPGVAQRTGSTSYYIEIAEQGDDAAVLSLVPMPARVDVLVSSEILETARLMTQGFVSPENTTVISSTARAISIAEKIAMGDGRFSSDEIVKAAKELSKSCHFLDLNEIAAQQGTFVSATMFGALAASGVLPWDQDASCAVLSDDRSRAGFKAAAKSVKAPSKAVGSQPPSKAMQIPLDIGPVPEGVATVISLGYERVEDFQDANYGAVYLARVKSLLEAADLSDHEQQHTATEACRRLALWMAYEDIARVADLKTRPDRFTGIANEANLQPGQVVTITEYLKPRAEEIADILPARLGRKIMTRVEKGRGFPFLRKGRFVKSNGVFGYWLLRLTAQLRRIRRHSLRFHIEQAAIEEWLEVLITAQTTAPKFAAGLAELPRVLKGYSDTLVRGKSAYGKIMAEIVRPALESGQMSERFQILRDSTSAAMLDETHTKLDEVLTNTAPEAAIPNLRPAHG